MNPTEVEIIHTGEHAIVTSRAQETSLTASVNRVCIVIVVLLGAFFSWGTRFAIHPDGMSYLDYSDRFLDGTWSHPNGYWSPGYPVVVAMVRRVIGTGPTGDMPALHIASFLGYLVAIAGFSLLLYALQQPRRSALTGPGEEDDSWLPTKAVWPVIMAWATFLWASLYFTRLSFTTPDMWVVAMTYWSTAAAVLVTRRRRAWPYAVLLGVMLGLGYLVKVILFPVGIVLVLTLGVVQWRAGAKLWNTAIAAMVFAAVALPQLVTQTRLIGHPTFGQTGVLVREWYVNDLPCPMFGVPKERLSWPTCIEPKEGSTEAIATQPFPRFAGSPSVYVFTSPPTATFAAWYDATQWYRSVRPTLHLHRQMVELLKNLINDWGIFVPFVAAMLAFMFGAGCRPHNLAGIEPVLVVPALATIGLYALSFSSARYLGQPAVLLILGTAGIACWTRSSSRASLSLLGGSPRWLGQAFMGASLVLLFNIFIPTADETIYSRREKTNPILDAAQAVTAAGIAPGSRIGIIGDGSNAFWARMARLHIIAEIHPSEGWKFWHNSASMQDSVINAFRRAGATAIVADPVPPELTLPSGWKRVQGAQPMTTLGIFQL